MDAATEPIIDATVEPEQDPIEIQDKPVEIQGPPRAGSPRAGIILEAFIAKAIELLPPDIEEEYFLWYVERNREAMLQAIDELVVNRPLPGDDKLPPDQWTPKDRTEANLKAMEIVAKCSAECRLSAAERRAIAKYSGWGGLSLKAVENRFPAGFPRPEIRGLIHEYYTPSNVAAEVARVCQEKIPTLPMHSGQILALEPAAGIGRLVRAFSENGNRALNWNVIEWSKISATMLHALHPELTLHNMPFETWVTEYGADFDGKLGLVVANPPYGARGAAVAEDPDRFYRESQAYAYFVRRGLDLLEKHGLGVYLVPYGLMSGQSPKNRQLREHVLLRHHLAAAYRLPSTLFPGAMIVVDLVFFRSRGGQLKSIPAEDNFIFEGRYFEKYPQHILGEEVGSQTEGWEERWAKRLEDVGQEKPAKPRWGYQIKGKFKRLPKVTERPLKYDVTVRNYRSVDPTLSSTAVGRVVKTLDSDEKAMVSANALGLRVDVYLSILVDNTKKAADLWRDLRDGLEGWRKLHGNPHENEGLAKFAAERVTGIERFLAAFTKDGQLIAGLQTKPKYQPRWTGSRGDVIGQADFLWRQKKKLTLDELVAFNHEIGGRMREGKMRQLLLAADWALDGSNFDEWVPPDIYYTGWVMPRWERCKKLKDTNEQAAKQYAKLQELLQIVVFDDIERLDPRQGWIPLQLVQDWVNYNPHMQGEIRVKRRWGGWKTTKQEPVVLEYRDGLYQIEGIRYESLSGSGMGAAEDAGVNRETVNLIGYMNYDLRLFRPPKTEDEDLTEKRYEVAANWAERFAEFLAADDKRRKAVEQAYMAQFKGWIEPTYSAEQFELARWGDMITPHGYQMQGARRLLENRGGLLAYDVGVGKTFTAILTIAAGRQEGFIRRPLILVPNTLVWKWKADIRKCCPDYQVVIIGATKTLKFPQIDVKLSKAQKDLLERLAFGGIKPAPAPARIINQLHKAGVIDEDGGLSRAMQQAIAELGDVGRAVEKIGWQRTKNQKLKAAYNLAMKIGKNELVAVNERYLKALKEAKLLEQDNDLTDLGKETAQKLKGHVVSKTDTPEERARKWTEFQAGMYDVAIITYTAFPRTKMNLTALEQYVARNDAIRREIEIQKRNIKAKKKPTERQLAILSEGEAQWLAEKTELPKSQRYDPGISFDDLGIDWLIVDEAQNFKNLYMPESREGGVPKYMGTGVASKRAWQLDFRCWTIRQHTGGGGIVLLSATPAKNSPLEFYNVIQYIDDGIWRRRGILNAEQFVSRYLDVEFGLVYDMVTAKWTKKNKVVGFDNAQELRDALYRYAQFLSAKDAGIELPKVEQGDPIIVPLNAEQEEKYAEYVYLAEKARKSRDPQERARFLAYMAYMSLVAMHAKLDEGYTWETATKVDPHAAKLDECRNRVLSNQNCGHIIFCENLAAQRWMLMVLVQAGIPRKRIGVFNATETKSPAQRQEMARKFNGGLDEEDMPDDTVPPALDVVIANQVAYEGIDLQRRTCEIHHLDLPWEPSTLQQRNGRGLRQGNILGVIAINVYISARTNDVVRFESIKGKHGWMTALLGTDQNRISNPAEAMKMSDAEMAAMCSRDPEEARRIVEEGMREAQQAEMKRQALVATKQAMAVASIYRDVRWETDPVDASMLRRQAERRMRALRDYVNAENWPYISLFERIVKQQDVWIVRGGPPLYRGQKIAYALDEEGTITARMEIGTWQQMSVYVRLQDDIYWKPMKMSDFEKLAWLPALVETPNWEESDDIVRDKFQKAFKNLSIRDPWSDKFHWYRGSNDWLKKWWPETEKAFLEAWRRDFRDATKGQYLPIILDGKLVIVRYNVVSEYQPKTYKYVTSTYWLLLSTKAKAGAAWTDAEQIPVPPEESWRIIPPTDEGWDEFIEAAIQAEFKIWMLDLAAYYWWGRKTPPKYITKEREARKQAKEQSKKS